MFGILNLLTVMNMKFRNIYIGIVCAVSLSACSDKMDYHEYTNYDNTHVFLILGVRQDL